MVTGLRLKLFVLLMAVGLSGCGFHLRGYDLSASVESYALAGKTSVQVAEPLRQALRTADVNEVAASEADVTVEFLDQRRDRRSISTTGGARAAEYETSYAVQYQLRRGPELLIEPTWIERERVFRIDRGNTVGSNQEQTLLEREMLNDVAGQIVRAMSAVSRKTAPETADAG